LARRGVDLGLLAHSDTEGIAETAEQCREAGAKVVTSLGDIRSSSEVGTAIDVAVAALGGLDILINNAGKLGTYSAIADMEEDVWREMIDSHLTGTFFAIKHAAAHMRRRQWGRIVNMSSIHGRAGGRVSFGHYGAAKAGVIALTKTVARELGPEGITCNVVAPGFIRTPQLEGSLGEMRLAALAQQVPVRRIGRPEEIAAAVMFLVSDDASYVNGAVIDVNGGRIEFV